MGTSPREATSDLDRLQKFFATLLADDGAYAKVTVSVQRGKLGMVHVDRSYTIEQLPAADR
jgi:hypothetical protein